MANETSRELTAVLSLLLGGPSSDAILYRPEGEIALIELTVNSLHTFSKEHLLQPLPLPFMQQFSWKEVPSQSQGQLVYGHAFCILMLYQYLDLVSGMQK